MTETDSTEQTTTNLETHRVAASVWERPGWDGRREPPAVSRLLIGVGGGALVWQGLRRQNWTGRIMAGIGGSLAWWALTGEGDLSAARHWMKGMIEAASGRSEDLVHQASDESFPASDAPSWTPTVGIGVRRGPAASNP